MTNKEKEHYEKLAKYYNSKTKTYNEIFGKETPKYKVIVEYEYPCEHKPPVEADIYLHGDKVTTSEITPIKTGHWIDTDEWRETVDGFEQWGYFRKCSRCGYVFKFLEIDNYCPNCGAKMEIQE